MYQQNCVLCDRSILRGQFCMGKVCFQLSYFKQQNSSLVFFKKKVFIFAENLLQSYSIQNIQKIVTQKNANAKHAKNLQYHFFRTYALSVGFQKKPLRNSVFLCYVKNQIKLSCKSCRKEQPFIPYLFDESPCSNTYTL